MRQSPRPPPRPGEKFERLTVQSIGVRPVHGRRQSVAVCLCTCGLLCEVPVAALRRGAQGTRSCGCLRREKASALGLRLKYGRAKALARKRARVEAKQLRAEWYPSEAA